MKKLITTITVLLTLATSVFAWNEKVLFVNHSDENVSVKLSVYNTQTNEKPKKDCTMTKAEYERALAEYEAVITTSVNDFIFEIGPNEELEYVAFHDDVETFVKYYKTAEIKFSKKGFGVIQNYYKHSDYIIEIGKTEVEEWF